MVRIVCIGGGTGLPVLLRGLGTDPDVDVAAIVSVADNGGSSGRLRDSFGIPAVGDLRNCLVAMSKNRAPMANVFQHRFSGDSGLKGHALGNLIVTALHEQTGNLQEAIEIAGRLLSARGRAYPVSETPATLCARFKDGSIVRGEWQVTKAGKSIERVWLEPRPVPPAPGVLETIRAADAVILAPGSLYTSLIPNLLVDGVAEAVRSSPAIKILVCNLMMQSGETDGFSASDHLVTVERYLGRRAIDFCLLNAPASSARLTDEFSRVVTCDAPRIRELGVVPIEADLLTRQGKEVRHNSEVLGRLVIEIAYAAVGQHVESTAA